MIAVFPANDPDLPTIDPILDLCATRYLRGVNSVRAGPARPNVSTPNEHRTLQQNDGLRRQATAPERHLGAAVGEVVHWMIKRYGGPRPQGAAARFGPSRRRLQAVSPSAPESDYLRASRMRLNGVSVARRN